MLKLLHKKHPVPAERLLRQKELFRYAKVSPVGRQLRQHGQQEKRGMWKGISRDG